MKYGPVEPLKKGNLSISTIYSQSHINSLDTKCQPNRENYIDPGPLYRLNLMFYKPRVHWLARNHGHNAKRHM